GYEGWNQQREKDGKKPLTPEDRRAEIITELAQLVPGDPTVPANASAADKVLAYVTKPMQVYETHHRGHGESSEIYTTVKTVKVEGDARILLENAIRPPSGTEGKTEQAIAARAVGLHEELNRPGGPRMGELTKLLIDKRLDPIRADLSKE